MRLAGRKGLVHEIAHDHFLTRSSVMEIAEVICELAESAQGGAFPVAQLRDRLRYQPEDCGAYPGVFRPSWSNGTAR